MKHNLKTIRQDPSLRRELAAFEEELREMYAHQKVIYKIPTVAIKEILGEASC